jgi:hypothetical protein
MRMPVRAGLVLVAVAACGSVAAPPAGGGHPRAGGTAPSAAVPGPPAGSRAEAAALARLMLSRLRLPAGTRRLPPTPLPPSLSQPAVQQAGGATSLDLHQLFAVAQRLDAVAAGLAARVPGGLTRGSTGEGSGPGGVTMREVSYTARSLPAGIVAAQLVLTVVPAGSGGSLLRADAEVIWYPSRSAAEYIDPARYHVLSIAVTIFNPRLRTIRKIVTSQAVITRLAEALDRSPAEPGTAVSCPMSFATYRLALSVSRSSRPTVVVFATRWPCGGSAITVSGQVQPALADDGAVVALADQALGMTPQP